MSALKKNLLLEQRATFRLVLTWKDAKLFPINLTGYSARLQIRLTPTSAVLFEASSANGKIVLGGAMGLITVTITDEETSALTFTNAVYDLKLGAPDGSAIRLLQGTVVLSPGVTV